MNRPSTNDQAETVGVGGPADSFAANTIECDAEAQTQLDQVATSLLAVACADPFGTHPEIRLHCLWAVDRLRNLGAHPGRTLNLLPAGAIPATLEDAASALALLPPDLVGGTAVDDAIALALSRLDDDR